MLRVDNNKIIYKQRCIIDLSKPFFYLSFGKTTFKMKRGNFHCKDSIALKEIKYFKIIESKDKVTLSSSTTNITITQNHDLLYIEPKIKVQANGYKILFNAYRDERIYGCGEQFHTFNLKKHKVRNWLSEHINLSSILRKELLKLIGVSKHQKFEKYSSYAIHSYYFEDNCDKFIYGAFDTFEESASSISKYFGIQPKLPEWVYDGIILGIQGGTKTCNKDAYEWYKNIVKENIIDCNLSGWMADFGEYLPADCKLTNGSATQMHNLWPVLWTKLNYEAIQEREASDRVMFFNRACYQGSSKYTPLMWNGDQHVDFSDDYGLGSVTRGQISLGLSSIGISHCDIGGYTTLGSIKRSKEVFIRWLQKACFTPVMRTHEGNRPNSNHQFDTDIETINLVSRYSRVHYHLNDYIKQSSNIYYDTGVPIIRPLFMHYDEEECLDIDYEYLFGRDMLVCPVVKKGATKMLVYLPMTIGYIFLMGKSTKMVTIQLMHQLVRYRFSIEAKVSSVSVSHK